MASKQYMAKKPLEGGKNGKKEEALWPLDRRRAHCSSIVLNGGRYCWTCLWPTKKQWC